MSYVLALLALQYHLLRHSLTGGKLVAYLVMACLGVAALTFAGLLAGLFYYLGAFWIPDQPRPMTLLALNLILVIYFVGWFWGIAMEVQRSDVIDIRKMLYFPVPIALINAINFGVSLVGFTSLFFLSGALGLLAGIYQTVGQAVAIGAFAAGAFFFAAATWAYYIRGLMALWMSNKRRRRLLMSVLPLFFMAAGFLPMTLTHTVGTGQSGAEMLRWLIEPAQFVWVERVSWCLPTGWLALALSGIVSAAGPVYLPVACLLGLGVLGYALGHRVTLRYCFGAESVTGIVAPGGAAGRLPFTLRRLPGLSSDSSGLTLAAFLSFTRHPQMRTMLLAPFGMLLFLVLANSRSDFVGQGLGVPAIVVIFPFFMFSAFFCNLFGMDPQIGRAHV